MAFLESMEKVYAIGEARAITDLVFESIAGLSKSDLIKNAEQKLDELVFIKLHDAMYELQSGKPVQYVLGQTVFCNHVFQVAQGVLIPRPETEELVQLVFGDLVKHTALKILDVGTGSGCIAISIQKAFPNHEVHAIEKSSDALIIAQKNAQALDADIHWHHADFLENQTWYSLPVFDIIVSNPPYIPFQEKETMEINVREFEPELALFVPDENPLIFYEAIAKFGITNLSSQGVIWTEIHADFGIPAQHLFESYGYDTALLQDENGKDRFIRAVNRCL
jgi:release factor glutamine methyltransferase